MNNRFYSDEEAQAILSLATKKSVGLEGMSRERLIQAASELGITPDAVIAAEQELERKRTAAVDRSEYKRHLRRELVGMVSGWFSTSVMLFGINYLTDGGFHSVWNTWAIWPVGIWGLVVLKNVIEFAAKRAVSDEPGFETWRQKRYASLQAPSGPDDATREVAAAALQESDGKQIEALKLIRERTGLGVEEAKSALDELDRIRTT